MVDASSHEICSVTRIVVCVFPGKSIVLGGLLTALVNFTDASWKQANAFNKVIPNKRYYELCSPLMNCCILHVICIVPFHIEVVHNNLLTHVYQH